MVPGPMGKRTSIMTERYGNFSGDSVGNQEYGPVQHRNKYGHNIDYYIKTRWKGKDSYINNKGRYIELGESVINSLQPILLDSLESQVKIIGQGDNVYNVVNKNPIVGEGRFMYTVQKPGSTEQTTVPDYQVIPATPMKGGSKKGRNKTLKKRSKK